MYGTVLNPEYKLALQQTCDRHATHMQPMHDSCCMQYMKPLCLFAFEFLRTVRPLEAFGAIGPSPLSVLYRPPPSSSLPDMFQIRFTLAPQLLPNAYSATAAVESLQRLLVAERP